MTRERGNVNTAGRVLVGIAAVVVVAAVIVVGYLGGWWLRTDVQDRDARVRRSTFEQQATYRDEIVRKIGDVRAIDVQIRQSPEHAKELNAQRAAIVAIICRDNTHIRGDLDADSDQFIREEC